MRTATGVLSNHNRATIEKKRGGAALHDKATARWHWVGVVAKTLPTRTPAAQHA